MYSRLALFAVLSLGAACVSAEERAGKRDATVELALSNDTLDLRYIGGGGDVGVSRASQFTGAFFLSEDRDIVLSFGLLFPAFQAGRLTLAAGPQAYAALLDEDNSDVLSITVGAQARFAILEKTKWGLAVSGRAFYGPDILTFGTADNLTDLSARVELQVDEDIMLFAGMRWFEFDLIEGGGEQTLQEEIFVGVGYRF
jgi:hypothetical protein